MLSLIRAGSNCGSIYIFIAAGADLRGKKKITEIPYFSACINISACEYCCLLLIANSIDATLARP